MIDVDDVCTHADLADEFGGDSFLVPMLPKDLEALEGDLRTKSIRQRGLDATLASLARHVPPVRDTDLANPAELKLAVVYHGAAWLNGAAMSQDGDAWAMRYREYTRKYRDEVTGMRPTLQGGATANVFSVVLERR